MQFMQSLLSGGGPAQSPIPQQQQRLSDSGSGRFTAEVGEGAFPLASFYLRGAGAASETEAVAVGAGGVLRQHESRQSHEAESIPYTSLEQPQRPSRHPPPRSSHTAAYSSTPHLPAPAPQLGVLVLILCPPQPHSWGYY